MKGFSFRSDVRLGNQLIALFHAFNLSEGDEVKLYYPGFDRYKDKFNITSLVDGEYYARNGNDFVDLQWGDLKDGGDLLRFDQLKLKPEYSEIVEQSLSKLGNCDLVAVHVRHGDFGHWEGGKHYFKYEEYLDVARSAIKRWGIKDYKMVVFSDEDQPSNGAILSRNLTNADPVIDLFLMSKFNYFIKTFSTFSSVAMRFSQLAGKYKDHYHIFK